MKIGAGKAVTFFGLNEMVFSLYCEKYDLKAKNALIKACILRHGSEHFQSHFSVNNLWNLKGVKWPNKKILFTISK